MSDPLTHPYSFGLPDGRLLDETTDDRLDEGTVFNISQFPRATPKRVEAARKYAREIPDERLDRTVDPWRDRETGEEFELVTSHFNIVDPAASGAVAFTVSATGTCSACAQRLRGADHVSLRRQPGMNGGRA